MQLNYFFETRAEAWRRQLLSAKKDKQASRNAKFTHIRDPLELGDATEARRIIRRRVTRKALCIVLPFSLPDTPFW